MSDSGPNRGSTAVDRSRAAAQTEMAAGTPPDTEPRSGPELRVPARSLADWFAALAADRGAETAIVEHRNGGTSKQTYEQLLSDARATATLLADRGVEDGSRVAIQAPSMIAEATLFFAVQFAGGIAVASTDTLTGGVEQADPSYLLAVEGTDPGVDVEQQLTVRRSDRGRVVVPSTAPAESLPGEDRDAEAIAALLPTAGTTGEPALPAVTDRNLLAGAAMLETRLSLDRTDRLAAVVPSAHALGTVTPLACWSAGGTVAGATIDTLLSDLRQLTPTRLLTVPRLCRRLYGTVERLQEGGGRTLSRVLSWAKAVAHEYGSALATDTGAGYRIRIQRAVADKLVFAALRRRLGLHRVAEIVAAGGPIDPELQTVFRGMGVPILSAYGTAETAGLAALPDPADCGDGTVGTPLPGCTVRLADDGEILVAGPQVIDQYWADELATRGAIIDDWFHTGDLGHWNEETLGVLDRKAHMQTLQNGTPVSPLRVERALRASPIVADAVAVAEDRPYVTALLEPAFGTLLAWTDRENVPIAGIERDESGAVTGVDADALQQAAVRNRFDDALRTANDRLAEHEQVEAVQPIDRPLDLEHGELTPLLTKRREQIHRQFRETIDALYE